jgi:hypothetical protein
MFRFRHVWNGHATAVSITYFTIAFTRLTKRYSKRLREFLLHQISIADDCHMIWNQTRKYDLEVTCLENLPSLGCHC